jgi:hypothetical protein
MVDSFRTILSFSTPPNTIAPSRPLPIGQDSVKAAAGSSNQRWWRGSIGGKSGSMV